MAQRKKLYISKNNQYYEVVQDLLESINFIEVTSSDIIADKLPSEKPCIFEVDSNEGNFYLVLRYDSEKLSGFQLNGSGYLSFFDYDFNNPEEDTFNDFNCNYSSYSPKNEYEPEENDDIANKGYVDTAVAGAGGTKLFSHTFNVNCTWTYDNVSRTGNVTFNVICTTENKFVNLTDTRFLAIKEYIMRGISNYSVLAVNLSGSLELTSFTDMPVGILNNFIAKSMIYISLPYPGATLSFGAYLADKIDLTTGVRANRTNVLSNVAVNSIGEDTVTPL